MSWFYETYNQPSAKNGAIQVVRKLGRWWVSVDNTGQTTPYLHAMWRRAFNKVRGKATTEIKEVLMLGLGAGGEIKNLRHYFPHCNITAIEFDPEMTKLAQTLKLYGSYTPTILQGDAAEVLPSLGSRYDLVMVDMFVGEDPSDLITRPEFRRTLRERLAPQGLLLVNAYKRTDYLDGLAEVFTSVERWRYKWNNLGLFSDPKSY